MDICFVLCLNTKSFYSSVKECYHLVNKTICQCIDILLTISLQCTQMWLTLIFYSNARWFYSSVEEYWQLMSKQNYLSVSLVDPFSCNPSGHDVFYDITRWFYSSVEEYCQLMSFVSFVLDVCTHHPGMPVFHDALKVVFQLLSTTFRLCCIS